MALLFVMLILILSACASVPRQDFICCERDPYSSYSEILKSSFPSLAICRNESDMFQELNHGTATEAYDTQAVPALREGIASYWYPQYVATVVIAVDRDQTDAAISGWSDLAASGEQISMTRNRPHSDHLLAAISYGLEGDSFSLHSAARLLAPLYSQKSFAFDKYDLPVLICFDYQAAAMIKDGRNLEIIIPAEGTLSFEKGLLSNGPLVLPNSSDAFIPAGFRLTNGTCDGSIYPPDSSYVNAKILNDYDHLNAEIRNTTIVLRREVQNTHRHTTADGHEHQVFALLYIVAVILWTGAISHRAMQRGVRRSTFICGVLLVGWGLARIIKYSLFAPNTFSRFIWYSYYIFELGLPLLLVWMALMIDKPEERLYPPKWWFAMLGVNTALILFVLTNDMHRLVFNMDLSGTLWEEEYSYGPVFYAIIAVIFLQILLSQIIMFRKSWQSPRKHSYLFPVALYLLIAIFCAAYAMRLPIVLGTDFTIVAGVFVLLYMEVCARIGLMPVNRNYHRFFTYSPNNMQIITSAGDTALASVVVNPIDESIWKGFCENPDEPQAAGENEMLFAGRIRGGMVVWQEDIRSINRLLGEIEISTEQLRRTNALLEQESVIRGRLAVSQARLSLFSALEKEIRMQSEKLSQMLHSIPAGENRNAYISQVALLVCYMKRRCHLFFMEKNNEETTAAELIVYLDELAEYARASGLRCLCNCILTGPVCLRQATLMYDLFYALLEWQQEHSNGSLFVQLLEEDGAAVMRVMPSGDMTEFCPEPEFLHDLETAGGSFSRRLLDDADGFWLTFPREGGDGSDSVL